MYVRIWRFAVEPDAVDAFGALYGPSGRWVQLFSRFDGYAGTELLTDVGDPLRFVTVDRWETEAAYLEMEAATTDEWRALDAEGARTTQDEAFLGAFETAGSERPPIGFKG